MKNKQNKGLKFENKVQKTIRSGGLWFQKQDLHMEDFCIEVKFTDKKSFRISNKILEKLWNEALEINKEPLLTIGIRRNEDEIFYLDCCLSIKKFKKKN